MLTLSPGFTVFDFHPARARMPGAVISTFHVSRPLLSLFGTSISIQECGLAHLNCLTVPTSTVCLERSKPVMEWCAYAAALNPRRQAQAVIIFFIKMAP